MCQLEHKNYNEGIKLDELYNFIVRGMLLYHKCNSFNENSGEELLQRIQNDHSIDSDVPIALIGIFKIFSEDSEAQYYSRIVKDEVCTFLGEIEENIIFQSLQEGINYFFNAIKSYFNIKGMIAEFANISYNEMFKNSFFRSSLYTKTSEEILMNLYRLIAIIISNNGNKDYRSQDTLGKILPVLKKYNLAHISNIDKNLRNSINHGNIIYSGDNVKYQYSDNGEYIFKTIKKSQYDNMIFEAFDIASGAIMGFLILLAEKPHIYQSLIENEEKIENKNNFLYLQFLSPRTKIRLLEQVDDINQLNIHIETNINDKNQLILSMFEILKHAYMSFPDYKNYFIGYEHPRSLNGFMRISNDELTKRIDEQFEDKPISPLESKEDTLLIFDILENEINEKEHLYHVFPSVKDNGWVLQNIEDCSTQDFKRLKGNIILDSPILKMEINRIVDSVISKMKGFYTPKNPKIDVISGTKEADAIFLHVFKKSPKRNTFNLFNNNDYFICSVEYYSKKGITKLNHGGVPEFLWKEYKKNKIGNVEYAWNPNYNIR